MLNILKKRNRFKVILITLKENHTAFPRNCFKDI